LVFIHSREQVLVTAQVFTVKFMLIDLILRWFVGEQATARYADSATDTGVYIIRSCVEFHTRLGD